MSTIYAEFYVTATELECARIFSEKRNQFRGLFDITSVKCDKTGTRREVFTKYSFYVHSNQKDAPTILSILKELDFIAKYV